MTPDWIADAACAGLTNVFYPKYNERRPARERRQQQAIAICHTCPVFAQCATYAKQVHAEDGSAFSGIWAGVIYHDRAEEQRQRSYAQSERAQATEARRAARRIKQQIAANQAGRKDVA